MTPGQLRERISGTTGHSQGIVSAVVISALTTYESFTENVGKAIKWLFFAGLRGQQALPVVSLDLTIIQDSIDGGEGIPNPMLSVTGLILKDLEPL
jgi:fatty acid synthase subunit beta